jgi:hypothetical protein
MASANIIGDLLVVFGLPTLILGFSFFVLLFSGIMPDNAYDLAHGFTVIKTLEGVAFVTILFTLTGISIGYYYLIKTIDIKFLDIFRIGYAEGSRIIKTYLPDRKS